MRTRSLLLLTLFLPLVAGGTPESPEVEDDAGDVAVTAGPLVVAGVNDEDFSDVDLLAGYLTDDGALLTLNVVTAAAGSPDLDLSFQVALGPTSFGHSRATGESFLLAVRGDAVDGAAGANVSRSDATTTVTVPLVSLNATGGDVITTWRITASRSVPGQVQGLDDQSATDEAGPGSPYTLGRPAPVGDIAVTIDSGRVLGAEARSFTGTPTLKQGDTGLEVSMSVTNDGLDRDTVAFTVVEAPQGWRGVFTPQSVELAAGGADLVGLEVTFEAATAGTLTFRATSALGATVTLTITTELATAAPTDRDVPSALSWLTPTAEALGLDSALGNTAEWFLLGLLLLLIVLIVFLALSPGRRKALTSPPPRTKPHPAATPAPARQEEPTPEEEPDGLPQTERFDLDAITRTRRPETTPPAPPAPPVARPAAGRSLPGRADVELKEVTHTPEHPEPGETVETTIVLSNRGDAADHLRVVLQLDDRPLVEEDVELPAGATRRVRLPWRAHDGPNRVRVQVHSL